MASADARGQIGGPGKHVEADETLVGGKLSHYGKGKHRLNKATVFGIIEGDGHMARVPYRTKPNTRRSRLSMKTSNPVRLLAVTGITLIAILLAITSMATWTTAQKNTCVASTIHILLKGTGRC